MTGPLIVAIDGPSGVGKSTVGRELARRLGIPYLDTGAMYRAVGLLAERSGVTLPIADADRVNPVKNSSRLSSRLYSVSVEIRSGFTSTAPAFQSNVMCRDIES